MEQNPRVSEGNFQLGRVFAQILFKFDADSLSVVLALFVFCFFVLLVFQHQFWPRTRLVDFWKTFCWKLLDDPGLLLRSTFRFGSISGPFRHCFPLMSASLLSFSRHLWNSLIAAFGTSRKSSKLLTEYFAKILPDVWKQLKFLRNFTKLHVISEWRKRNFHDKQKNWNNNKSVESIERKFPKVEINHSESDSGTNQTQDATQNWCSSAKN